MPTTSCRWHHKATLAISSVRNQKLSIGDWVWSGMLGRHAGLRGPKDVKMGHLVASPCCLYGGLFGSDFSR